MARTSISRSAVGAAVALALVAVTVAVAPSAVAVPVCGSGSTSFAGGDGSLADPYEVATAGHLALVTDASCTSGFSFIQTADIDLASVVWTPGTLNGTYEGNGRIVSNLNVSVGAGWGGLFGSVLSGSVYNLTLSSFTVYGIRAGALAGYTMTSSAVPAIYNVRVVGGSISASNSAGGLVGQVFNATILDCTSSASVSAPGVYSGGLVAITDPGSGSITGSAASGTVAGVPAGGLVGWARGDIAMSDASGAVTSSNSAAGGLVGTLGGGSITDSSATGSVTSPTGTSIGGLVGSVTGGTSIVRSWSSGDVSASGYDGGLIGNMSSAVPVSDVYARGGVAASDAGRPAGGLLTAFGVTPAVTRSYATGLVTGASTNRAGLIPASATVANGFYNSTGQSGLVLGLGTSQTSAELEVDTTFTGFDFTDVWTMPVGGGYPLLQRPSPSAPTSVTLTAAPGATDTQTVSVTNSALGATHGLRSTLAVKGYAITGDAAQRGQFAITSISCNGGGTPASSALSVATRKFNADAVVPNGATCDFSVTYTNAASATAVLTVYTNAGAVSTALNGGPADVTLVAPTAVSVAGGATAGSITVTFTASTNAPAGQLYSARIYSDATLTALVDTKPVASGTTLSGLIAGAPYWVTVTADASTGYLASAASVAGTGTATASSGGGGGGGGGGASGSGSVTNSAPSDASTPASSDPLAPVATPQNQGLEPGQIRVTQGGVAIPAITTTSAELGTQTVSGQGWSTSIGGTANGGTATAAAMATGVSIPAGGLLGVGGSGYQPGTTVQAYGLSPTSLLGSLTVGSDGTFRGVVPIATGSASGSHVLQVNGFASPSSVRSVSLGYVVTRATATGRTATALIFPYRSARLTPAAKRALRDMVAQVPSGVRTESIAVGWLRSVGASAFDRNLAGSRARNVAAYVRQLGLKGTVVATTKEVDVRNEARYRRVTVTVRFSG